MLSESPEEFAQSPMPSYGLLHVMHKSILIIETQIIIRNVVGLYEAQKTRLQVELFDSIDSTISLILFILCIILDHTFLLKVSLFEWTSEMILD